MSARDIAELEAELAAEVQQRQALLVQIEEERSQWQKERAEMLEEMAEEAAERRRLLQQQNSERALHKEERLKLIYQVEALMHQVNVLDLKLEAVEAANDVVTSEKSTTAGGPEHVARTTNFASSAVPRSDERVDSEAKQGDAAPRRSPEAAPGVQ